MELLLDIAFRGEWIHGIHGIHGGQWGGMLGGSEAEIRRQEETEMRQALGLRVRLLLQLQLLHVTMTFTAVQAPWSEAFAGIDEAVRHSSALMPLGQTTMSARVPVAWPWRKRICSKRPTSGICV